MMNPSIQEQIKAAKAQLRADQKRLKGKSTPKPAESKGEASVRLALTHAFGDWFAGGEVVAELEPFAHRAFRADFALPRYRAAIEVDGWQHHGRTLYAHHSDRLRGIYFAQFGWVCFRVSHKQALSDTPILIDAIQTYINRTEPTSRESISVVRVTTHKGFYHKLTSGHDDA